MKLDRLLALAMLLANNRLVTAPELARRFEVSVRTIYRDIEALNQAGIPVIAYRGARGGIGLMEGYQMDRSLLTTGEIISVLATLEDVTAVTGDQVINNALDKLRGLLPEEQIAELRPRGRDVCLDLAPWTGSRDERVVLRQLRLACVEAHPVQFAYTSRRGETIRRTVEPVLTVLRKDAWYLYAFCRLRQEYRVFKLSRIADVQVLDETFVRHAVDTAARPWDNPIEEPDEMIQLVVRFAPAVRARVMDEFDPRLIQEDERGYLVVSCLYPLCEWLYGQILGFGPEAEILAPAEVRAEFGRRLTEMISFYRD